jgi:hypothetical protein
MTQGQTLWEMLQAKLHGKPPAAPIEFYNPLNHAIGDPVLVEEPGAAYENFNFSVQSILETDRAIGQQIFKFTDYVLGGTNANGDKATLRLRCVPNTIGGGDKILLALADEFKFDPGFLEVLNDASGQFNITDDESQQTEGFERINGTSGSYATVVRVMTLTKAGVCAAPDQEQHFHGEYWDYWRETPPASVKEFVFIELNADTGWFQIWRGREYVE